MNIKRGHIHLTLGHLLVGVAGLFALLVMFKATVDASVEYDQATLLEATVLEQSR